MIYLTSLPSSFFAACSSSGSLADSLLQGKTLKKSASLKNRLTFDRFEFTSGQSGKDESGSSPVNAASQAQLGMLQSLRERKQLEKALFCVQETNRLLPLAHSRHELNQDQSDSDFLRFQEKRALALKWLANSKSIDISQNTWAAQLSENCLDNLLEPQFFEPVENVVPIFNFYLRTHPEVSPCELADNLCYVENCYESALGEDEDVQRLRQKVYSKSHT